MHKRNNKTFQVNGYNSSNQEQKITHEQPFSDVSTGKHYGMPVTPEAFVKMIDRFKDQMHTPDPNNPFKDVLWVEFSKASIFRILAQEECDYIRFYMAIPNDFDGQASLSLQGVNSAGKTIKREIIEQIADRIDTQGDNGTLNENDLDYQNLLDTPPPFEEKGNPGSTLLDKPIKSLLDFVNSYGFVEENLSLSEFIRKLHDYQEEKF